MGSPSQLPLADDLFLTAHDSVRGRSLLSPATLGLGLASALLAELILWRRVDLSGGLLTIVDERHPGDAAVAAVLEQLRSEPQHRQIRDWIAFLATGAATDLVARRLARAGLVRRQEKRGLRGVKVTHVPADPMIAGWPASRVLTTVSRREHLDISDLLLAGLILATGLDQHVFSTIDSRDRGRLAEQMRSRLPAVLRELIGHAEAAVGDAVMARRA